MTGTTISSTWANNTLNDIATALTQSVASTGVTTPTANLPMGTYRHTGVGNATAQANYASVTDVQNGSLITLSAVAGTVDAITATAPLTVAAYAAGQGFEFVSAGANTGAVTINISGLGAKSITKFGSTALAAGDIPSGGLIQIVYDGTRFQIVGGLQPTAATQAQMEAASSNAVLASPGTVNWHPGVAKAWLQCNGAGTIIAASHNITSITDNGTGDLTVTIATDFSSANYVPVASIEDGAARTLYVTNPKAAGAVSMRCYDTVVFGFADPFNYHLVIFGDQA